MTTQAGTSASPTTSPTTPTALSRWASFASPIAALAASLFVLGCGEKAAVVSTPDMAVPDLSVSYPPPPWVWERGLPATSTLYPVRRGLRDVRGIIHLHSVSSHDACDGNPRPKNMRAMPCYTDLRDGLCGTRQDYAMLTDHDDNMADQDWEELFTPMDGDE